MPGKNNADGSPAVSVVLPAYFSHETIYQSLQSITRQTYSDFELIVVDSSPNDLSEKIVREHFPGVRYFRSPQRMLPHEARNWGVQQSRGQILVFADPDCLAEPHWLEHLMTHHSQGRSVVGGAIQNIPGWWNRSVQASKYAWWLPEAEEGPRSEIPSGNFSLSREVWSQVRGFNGAYFAGDSEICWRIREAGHEIWFEPRAMLTHLENPRPLAFVRERFRRGRDFGRMRLDLRKWSRLQLAGYLLATPLVPWVMTWRSAQWAVSGRYFWNWLPTFPVQFLGNAMWALGEAGVHWEAVRKP